MTLEKIQEMNLQIGDKVELTLEPKESQTKIRYFISLNKEDKYMSVCQNKFEGKLVNEGEAYKVNSLDDIKILEYKK